MSRRTCLKPVFQLSVLLLSATSRRVSRENGLSERVQDHLQRIGCQRVQWRIGWAEDCESALLLLLLLLRMTRAPERSLEQSALCQRDDLLPRCTEDVQWRPKMSILTAAVVPAAAAAAAAAGQSPTTATDFLRRRRCLYKGTRASWSVIIHDDGRRQACELPTSNLVHRDNRRFQIVRTRRATSDVRAKESERLQLETRAWGV